MISYNPIIIFLSPTPLLPLSSSLSSLTHVCMLGCFSHPTLCNPMDHNQPGSSVQGFLQARIQVHCHALFQGIFPTQGSNLHLFMSPALAGATLPLSHLGIPDHIPLTTILCCSQHTRTHTHTHCRVISRLVASG